MHIATGCGRKTIGVVTVGRSDYGVYVPVLRAIQAEPSLRLQLFVGGMHLSPEFGSTVAMIEADGFSIADRVDMLLVSDTPEGIAAAIGRGVAGFARAYQRQRPDLLLVLGDRFEMFAAAVAAVPFKLPMAHIAGGELTEGAIDDSFRHSMTKLSHLHFVATQEYARRVIQMGEEPWRVTVSGAPHLDHLRATRLLSREALESRCGIRLGTAPLLVTYHPVTLEYEHAGWQIEQLLQALADGERPVIFTLPNADTNGRIIRRRIEAFVGSHPNAVLVPNLGTQAYVSLMAIAGAMVGNSSSGLVEAPFFGLPVVNIGTRQQGRIRARNVIDCGYEAAQIRAALRQALQPGFREEVTGGDNPYGDGHAAERIVARLALAEERARLLRKPFVDLEPSELLRALGG
jgi:UDP-hydrolysing UDP-N-acetyl-D-glucosamine 2-epimerase